MKKIATLIALILPLAVFGLTLEEAVSLAKENNAELKIAKEDVQIAAQEYYDIRGSIMPQVSLQGAYSLTKTEIPKSSRQKLPSLTDDLDSASSNDSLIAGFVDGAFGAMIPGKYTEEGALQGQVGFNQVLYTGGKLLNGIRIADRYKTLKGQQLQLKENEVIYTTKDMFNQALLAKEALNINQEALNIATEHYTRVISLYGQGQVSEYDKLRAEIEVEKLKPDVEKASNDYKLAKEALARQIGRSTGEFELEGEITLQGMITDSLDVAIETALNQRLELSIAQQNREIYKANYSIEKANFMPSVGLSGSYALFTAADDYNIESNDYGNRYQVSLGVSVPLFTGFSNTAKRAKARHQLSQATITEFDTKDLVRLDVRSSWLNLQHSMKDLYSRQKSVDLAQKGLAIAQNRYENSVGIQLEVFDAQLQLNLARLNKLSATYNAVMANEKLKKAMGYNL